MVVGPGGGDDSTVSTDDSPVDSQVDAPVEMRGVWVTRWTYSSPTDVQNIMKSLGDAGFNAVFFQVRGTFDAYYDSAHEPWASRLAGLGTDPGWDPLAVAVEAGHANGLQVHAYINTFPMWSGTSEPNSSGIPHAYESNPDWLLDGMTLNSSYVFADPAEPGVQARVAAVAADIEAKYDVDGVHLDYIRYHAKGAGSGPRQAHIEATAQAVNDVVGSTTSAAVWGIHTNVWGWDNVSQGAADYGQDSHAMLASGALDEAMPMAYWPVQDGRLDFRAIARHHLENTSGKPVHIGISPDALTPQQVKSAVRVALDAGAAGVVFFDAVAFLEDRKTVDPLK